MWSEIVYRFLSERSKGSFERLKKLVWAANKQAIGTPLSFFVKVLKLVQLGEFVERTIVYKM